MKTKDFLKEHSACVEGAQGALSISDDMAGVWDALIKEGRHAWLMWTATRPGVFSESVLRKLTCRFVRETPLADGRKVGDLLTDERSRIAIEVAERYADGKATETEMAAAAAAAFAAARDAAYDAYDAYDAYAANDAAAARAAYVAAFAVARDAARAADAASRAAADAAAISAQIRMVAELGNPFKKGAGR